MLKSRRICSLAVALLAASIAAPFAARSAPTGSAPVFRPISTKAPAWYTREMQQKVIAAGDRGYVIPDGISVPTSSLAFLGIRPGQQILISGGGANRLCTSNFVFRNGSNYAIGTAGHCGDVGDQVSMLTAPRVLVNIGTITKSTGDAGIGNDFALISIKSSLNKIVSPSMAFWGGPKGAWTKANPPWTVKHTGWGLIVGTGGTPRTGLGIYNSPTEWLALGVISFGDSGSPANSANNLALGNITHLSVLRRGYLSTVAGTSIKRILQIAGLPLATCPQTPWPLYGCPPKL